MRAITLEQPKRLSEKERKGLLLISPILIGATVYGASISYWVLDHFVRLMF
ncbi:MAG: hypothetical protein ABS942_07055 [Solibacillus sp.]|uniref:hypothetical protein n=1 Tax=unclassified Solibacillus TaxID=2637870 RepID=UPI0031019375